MRPLVLPFDLLAPAPALLSSPYSDAPGEVMISSTESELENLCWVSQYCELMLLYDGLCTVPGVAYESEDGSEE